MNSKLVNTKISKSKCKSKRKQTDAERLKTNASIKKKASSPIKKKKRTKSQQAHITMLMDELFLLSDSCTLTSDEEEEHHDGNKRNMVVLPHLANYILSHPNEPPENYLYETCCSLTKHELSNPIESLHLFTFSKHAIQQEDATFVTKDELEALQGFGRFFSSTCQK